MKALESLGGKSSVAVLGGEDDPPSRALFQVLAWSHLDRWGRVKTPAARGSRELGSTLWREAGVTEARHPADRVPPPPAWSPVLPLPASCSWAHWKT